MSHRVEISNLRLSLICIKKTEKENLKTPIIPKVILEDRAHTRDQMVDLQSDQLHPLNPHKLPEYSTRNLSLVAGSLILKIQEKIHNLTHPYSNQPTVKLESLVKSPKKMICSVYPLNFNQDLKFQEPLKVVTDQVLDNKTFPNNLS